MSEFVSKTLRNDIQCRANFRCEYCQLAEKDAGLACEPDHIIATKHRGLTILANLAWACFSCNRFKGSDIASIDEKTGRLVRLYNPRKDSWQREFRWHGLRIIPLTAIGRVTEFLLQLNHPDRLDRRAALTT